jgi:acylaminoacyl-peptidase
MHSRIAASLLIGASLAAAAVAAELPGLRAEDVFELEVAGDPQISPDGKLVAYVRQFADVTSDRRRGNLWVVEAAGGGHRALTTGRHSDGSPRWSPDGTRLAFVSDRDGSPQIWVLWLGSGQTARLTDLRQPPQGLSWSPDGKWLAFTALVPGKGPAIATLPSAPEGAKWAEPAKVIDRLVYRFNRAGYLAEGNLQLFVVPADGGTPRQISAGDFDHGEPGGGTRDPLWTPDGGHLLIAANRRPDAELEPLDTEIWEFALADGAARALTDRRGPDESPALSPDGRRLAYVGFDDRYQGYQLTRLYVADRDGGGARVLLPDLDRDVEEPRWARDGGGVYFLYDERGTTKLGHAGLDGRWRVVAAGVGGGTGMTSYTGGGGFSLAGGTVAFTHKRWDLPGEVAVVAGGGGEPRLLTALNADLLAQRRLGEVEEIEYPSSKDGRRIQGWVVKPPGFDPGRRYPLILEIHGGPFAAYGAYFDLEKQVWAAMGYVVLYVNPRGSTSYGEEFGNLIHHAYPGDDFHDLDAGVDAVVARGYVDAENVFVTGGSGGGVLTCWMIGKSSRFRAAASAYPVINWTSWVLTADIAAFGVKYWFPGPPWEHPEHYARRSLLSVVGNVATPTMVITGEEDWRTPISESEQYYTALKLRGVEAVLVRFPGEPHGIRSRPSHHAAKILHIAGWFDKHRRAPAP